MDVNVQGPTLKYSSENMCYFYTCTVKEKKKSALYEGNTSD